MIKSSFYPEIWKKPSSKNYQYELFEFFLYIWHSFFKRNWTSFSPQNSSDGFQVCQRLRVDEVSAIVQAEFPRVTPGHGVWGGVDAADRSFVIRRLALSFGRDDWKDRHILLITYNTYKRLRLLLPEIIEKHYSSLIIL